ncbi:MAG: hypothetical protein ACYDBX_01365 [Patescibacteria group bacterium]
METTPSKEQMVNIVYGELPVMDLVYEELKGVGSPEVVHVEDEALSYYYPRSIENVVRKANYRSIQLISSVGGMVERFQMLPDGGIVTSSGNMLSIWRDAGEVYEEQELLTLEDGEEFQMLPDGRIVTRCEGEGVKIWTKNGKEYIEEIQKEDTYIWACQMLPDGRIVTSNGENISIRESDGVDFRKRVLLVSDLHISKFQMLSDRKILTMEEGEATGPSVLVMHMDIGEGFQKQQLLILDEDNGSIEFQMLPDGRIVINMRNNLSMWEDVGKGYKEQELLISDREVLAFQVLQDGRIIVSTRDKGLIILDGDSI